MANRIVFLNPKHLQKFIQDAESGTVYKNLAIMGVHDEDGERQLSEPPATRDLSTPTSQHECLPLKTVGRIGKSLATQIGLKESQTGQRLRSALKLETKATSLALRDLSRNVLDFQDFAYQFLSIPLPRLPDLKGFQFPNWKILQYVSELPNLPKLNRLTLRFQLTKASIVLNLLRRTRPGGLFIGPMWLDPGRFKPIFEFCCSPESNMQKLEVRAPLYQMGPEERGQIHFQRQPYDEDAECFAHLRREGEGVRRPIHFHSDPQTFIEVGTSFCNLLLNSSGAFDDSQAHTF
ncbi:f-box domain-containing protein [Fusarium napiforme]|uniref:F-box domain-containing protein n=1 Tax=Fusarium napiforme TaxID=42672 RepID=A0A8H5JRC0_9HYPO|nr:f-box domain-containing protein [Fusarium napiforme]